MLDLVSTVMSNTLVVLLVSLVTCGWMHNCSRDPMMATLKLTYSENQFVI